MTAAAPSLNRTDWPRIVATLCDPHAPADVVERNRQIAAAETMAAYPEPVPTPSPPGELYRLRDADLKTLTVDERAALRAYVVKVTEAEERNHGSLLALLEAIAVLRASGDATSRACAGELAKRTWRDYPGVKLCLRGDPLPDTLAERHRLARCASRDYARCPRFWRWA